MTDTNAELEKQIAAAHEELQRAQQKLAGLRRSAAPEPVQDYELRSAGGTVRLSEMFDDKQDLILVHNMGAGCPYCTMWADEFNGVLHHLQDRAAFAVVSPNSPKVQQNLAGKRGWRFPMYSAEGSTFVKDMGFQAEDGQFMDGYAPGVSVFRKNGDGSIVRVSRDFFGPGDPYCGVWHLFDLLPDGPGDWSPQFDYSAPSND